MPTHIAIVRSEPGRFRARVPDYPTIVVEGDELGTVLEQTRQTLVDHLATLPVDERAGRPVPLQEVLADLAGPAAAVELTVPSPQAPAVRINITLPEDLLRAVDRAAEAHSMPRSRFLARAVEATITGERHGGVRIPLSEEVLRAVDDAARAHDVNRVPFLARLIETTVARTRHCPES
jgi:hypothetical protein